MRYLLSLLSLLIVLGVAASAEDVSPEARKAEYVHAVTRGAGWMPWQARGVSERERAFRAQIEQRKDVVDSLVFEIPMCQYLLFLNEKQAILVKLQSNLLCIAMDVVFCHTLYFS